LFAGIMDKYYRQREKDWTESKYVSRLKEMIAVERSLEETLKKYDSVINKICNSYFAQI
jgi:spore coat-associated protein S